MSLMSLYTHLIVVDELKANLRIYIHTTGYNIQVWIKRSKVQKTHKGKKIKKLHSTLVRRSLQQQNNKKKPLIEYIVNTIIINNHTLNFMLIH